jgi:hypothetical protein
VKHHAKASSAGSTEGGGSSRGLVRRAFAFRGASGDVKGSGTRSTRRHPAARLLAILTMAILTMALVVAPASADEVPTGTVNTVPAAPFTTAHLTGTVNPFERLTYYGFEYSTDQVNWTRGPTAYYGGNPTVPANSGPTEVSEDLTGLQARTEYFVRIGTYDEVEFTEHFSPGPYLSFTALPVTAPTVASVVDVSDVDLATAHLSGFVTAGNADPAFDSSCHFAYVAKARFLIDGFASAQTIACSPATVTGAAPTPVEADLSGLDANREYVLQLVAANQGGSSTSDVGEFSTPVSAPWVVTGQASDRTPTTARLNGTLRAFGKQTSYRFEYGLTTAYGSQLPVDHEGLGGAGYGPLVASQPIAGLQPGATYHFRLVAHNEIGESFGLDRTFTTLPNSPSRAYELVTPPDKGSIDISSVFNDGATNGDHFAFSGATALGGAQSSPAAPLNPFYSASRTPTGWTSRALDAPQTPLGFQQRVFGTLGVSSDGTKAVVSSLTAMAPGAVEGNSNLYLEDTATGALTTIGTTPGTGFYVRAGYPPSQANVYVGGTPDFSHVLFNGDFSVFLPGAPPGALYEFTDGQLRVASMVGPEGSEVPDATPQVNLSERESRRISDDGSHVFFTGASNGFLYVRLNGSETKLISASQRSSDPPGTAGGGEFTGASSDGNVVFFLSANLTDDSPPGDPTLYRYVLSSNTLTRMGGVEGPDSFMQASADGAYAYFKTRHDLGDGATPGVFNFYVWHGGTLRRIATLDADSSQLFTSFRVSLNGRYLALASVGALTGSGATSTAPGHQEVYRYDAEADQLTCVSCPVNGASPTSDAGLSSSSPEFSHHYPKNVTNDGRVFFDTGERLAAADTNKVSDVYEYDGEQPKLISSGTGSAPSLFLDASLDARDVFFITKDQLVGIDTDTQADVYDARIGGGFASQNPPPPREECIRDDCKATPSAGPELPFGGSEGLNGPENVKAPARKRCPKGTQAKKVKGKSRCVKQHKKRTDNNRRQAR